MKMPFGKYKGRDVTEVPESYLSWALGHVKLEAGLARAIVAQLGILALERKRDRLAAECYRPIRREFERWVPSLRPLIDEWYRDLCRRLHPDHGGDHKAMVAINIAREMLLERLPDE